MSLPARNFGDCCPACLCATRTVTAQPSSVRRDGPCLLAEYACPACGHCWATGWLLSALGGAV